MTDSHALIAFLITCGVFVLIPGPSVLLVIRRRVSLGRTDRAIVAGTARTAPTGRRD